MKRKRIRLVYLVLGILMVIGIVNKKDSEKPTEAIAVEDGNEYVSDKYSKNNLLNGVYQGTGDGFIDKIVAEMTVENGRISKFEVIEDNETSTISKKAIAEMTYDISNNPNNKIDIVSGATETSEGVIDAFKDCIRQAGGNPDNY